MLEALIGVLLLGGMTILVLNQQVTANQVQQTNQGLDRAEAVAMDILNQAQSAGCGTATGTETATVMTQMAGGCNWASINNGELLILASSPGTSSQSSQPRWEPPTTIAQLCSKASNRSSSSSLVYLDSTPWFCQQQSNQWFTVQLRTDWTTLNGSVPACPTTTASDVSAPPMVSASQPLQVARTVEVMWVDNNALRYQSWTTLSPVPPNAVATQLVDGGGVIVTVPPTSAAYPVQMQVANQPTSLPAGQTPGLNTEDVYVWPQTYNQVTSAWLPFLPAGSTPIDITNPQNNTASPSPTPIQPMEVECLGLSQ
jgi:hypothetical protein